MLNIEIPPSAPVTNEEREKWLKKAEYGGKTRRLIDHIARLEEELDNAYAYSRKQHLEIQDMCPFDADDPRTSTCKEFSSCGACLRAHFKQVEAERDKLAAYLGSPVQSAFPPCEGNGYDCDIICPFTDREMAPVECWLEWARNAKTEKSLCVRYKYAR